LSQYLNGHIPLNAQALLKICALIGAAPAQMSPSIVEVETRRAQQWVTNIIPIMVGRDEPGLRKSSDQKRGALKSIGEGLRKTRAQKPRKLKEA
jgi:hypothetical protein